MAKYSKTAEKLLPHLLQEMQVQPVIIAQADSGGAMAVHALDGAYHSGTLAEAQAPWAVTATTFGLHAADPDAHHAAATAGNGIIIAGQQVAIKLPGNSGLTADGTGLYVGVSGLGLSKSGGNVVLSSSSRPAGAAAILATDALGHLQLEELYVDGYVVLNTADAGLVLSDRTDPTNIAKRWVAYSSGDFYLYRNGINIFGFSDTGTIATSGDMTLDPSGGEIFIPGADTLRSSAWTSGVLGTGWGLQERGGAGRSHLDIRSIYCDELIATTFTADQVRVRSGSDWLGEALAIAARDNSDNKVTIPNVGGGSVRIYVEDAPEVTGQIFDNNEYVLIKTINRSSGLAIRETWGQVSSYIAESGGRQSYSWTTVSGSGNFALEPGTALTGFGVSAGSYILRSVIEAGKGPFERFATWSTNPYTPANRVSRVEIGDIKNVVGDSTTRYGIAAGNNLALTPTTGFSGFTSDSVYGMRLFNAPVSIYNGSNRESWLSQYGLIMRTGGTGALIRFSPEINSDLDPYDIARIYATDASLTIVAYDRGSPYAYADARLSLRADNAAYTNYASIYIDATSIGSTVTVAAETAIALSAPSVAINGGTAWHSGNDGSGSGLDADKLDNYEAAAFGRLAADQNWTGQNTFAKAGYNPLVAYQSASGMAYGVLFATTGALATSSNNDQMILWHHANNVMAIGVGDSSTWNTLALQPEGGAVGIGLASAEATATLHVARGSAANGTAIFGGTTYNSHFNFSTTENTYIRGGKAGAVVYVNDVHTGDIVMSGGGNLLVGTSSNTYSARLNVSGNIHSDAAITAENFLQLKQRSGSPGSASGFGRIYYDSGDDKLKYITSGGTVRTLSYT